MNLLLGLGINHVHRPFAVGAEQTRGRPEEAANQRTLAVDLAAIRTQVRTAQIRKRMGMLGLGPGRQSCHFFGRSRHRPAAVVATDDAGKRRNALAQFVNFPIILGHTAHEDRPLRALASEELRPVCAGARAGARCFVRTCASRSRTPRPPRGLVSPSSMSSTPAARSAAINFIRESTVPRITPSLPSMRCIVGTDSRAACAKAR